jgi:NhaA family Na+:H+ antiporter
MSVSDARRAGRAPSLLRRFLDAEASGGLVLMAAAVLALIVANSPLSDAYFGTLKAYLGPLSLLHWINDALMAVFFLFVGLEIKREMLDGQLATWSRRALPGLGALGGMAMPALVYLWFTWDVPELRAGWAIPAATDIAFALGVISLLGSRVPASLKVFLAALAIIDDLGAVLIIALFYTADLSVMDLGLAAVVVAVLAGLNRAGVRHLTPYLLLGAVLWVFVFRSGVHATIAGVLLALTIPLHGRQGQPDDLDASPLHRLEHGLHLPVAFLVVPIFGFANAGVALGGVGFAELVDPLTLGVAGGLLVGKLVGVFGAAVLTIRLGLAELPMGASWTQLAGVALLCGIGFTMSLFIGLLAFAGNEIRQEEVKIGILGGSLVAGLLGYLVLRIAPRRVPAPAER